MVKGYRHLNRDAKALADPPLYIRIKLRALVRRNRVG